MRMERIFWSGDEIQSLKEDEIFVYGANPEFRNGLGAALVARQFGAKPYGGGRGIVGQTYGLITKNLKAGFHEKETGITYHKTGYRSVSKEQICKNIMELYAMAALRPELKFLLAYKNDGRNLNGYSPDEIWGMFSHNGSIPDNIVFHDSYKPLVLALDDKQVKPEEKSPFTFFWKSASPFSQWHPSIFTVKGKTFTSAEQFMMYCKAMLFNDTVTATKILDMNTQAPLCNYLNGSLDRNTILNTPELRKKWDQCQYRIKQLGREVDGFQDAIWKQKRVPYVRRGSLEKFNQDEELLSLLMATQGTELVETSPSDPIWGIGLSADHPDAMERTKWRGLNLLGDTLTDVRNRFEISFKMEQNQNITHQKNNNFEF